MTRPDFFDGWETRLRAVSARVPTTVLWGAQDPLIPVSYAGSIGGTVKLLADCGHWMPLEQPARVADEVRVLVAGASRHPATGDVTLTLRV
jgi:pimeloyl-ACP methyl ester carboxylesterase